MLHSEAPSPPVHRARPAAAPWREGWTLTLIAGGAVTALALAIILGGNASAGAIGLAIRTTARTSFALFLAAFTASALHRLWPGPFTRWLRRNRRNLGVAFAISHGVHAAAIITLAVLQPAAFHATGDMGRVPGLIGYGFIALMTATSFDRTAAAIGPRAWRLLHTVGSLYLWGAFLQAFAKRAPHAPAYWPLVAIAVGALVLRVVAWRHQRARRAGLSRSTPTPLRTGGDGRYQPHSS